MKATCIRLMLTATLLCCGLSLRAATPSDAVWIDARTTAEYDSGHLQQARLIPFDGIEAGVAGLQLDKDTPIYLYCAAGGRAEVAKQRLQAQGYSRVTNAGGLEDARRLHARLQQGSPEGSAQGQ